LPLALLRRNENQQEKQQKSNCSNSTFMEGTFEKAGILMHNVLKLVQPCSTLIH
jgi:hypothetical protein